MKFFVIALLFCVTPIASSSTDSVGENEYRVIPFTTNLREAMKNDSDWKMCGNYFAEVGIAEKKIVHFSFDKGSPGTPSTAFTFTMIDQVAVSINGESAGASGHDSGERTGSEVRFRDEQEGLRRRTPLSR